MPGLRTFPAVLLALTLSTPAVAQTVVGAVLEGDGGRPLPGAFVVLLAEDGRRLNGVLSGENGAFRIRAPAPGRYRLVAERIGYSSTRTELLDLKPGAAARHDITVPVEAVSLDGIQVETRERCRRRPGSGAETARLWEEARKALEVTRWSGGRGLFRYLAVAHTRELDARSLRVTRQTERPRRAYHDGSPYESIPAEALHQHGFIRQASDGTWDYFAPDAAVLLSDAFLEDHCFRVVPPPASEPDLLGLGFEPVPERSLPDVQGVLWIERGTAELRRLDYRYTRLPFRHGHWPEVGGRVEFERLANGVWIVRRWHIRMPLAAREAGGYSDGRPTLELVSLVEMGGEVREVRTPGGRLLAEAAGATLQGTVSTTDGRGLGGALVEIPALRREVAAAPDGAFRMTDLPEGVFEVLVRHPAYRGADGAAPPVIELHRGRATRLLATLEPRPAPGLSVTAGQDGPTWTNGVVGRVLADDAHGGLENATVRLIGEDSVVYGRIVTDGSGRFRLIHPGQGTVYTLEVERSGYLGHSETIRLRPGQELTVQVVLARR